jgi:hypothetical protein
MRWQKGQSGNPGGRPKALQEVEEAARRHTPEAIRALAGIANNEKAPPAARVSAAVALLDRAWGRPRQDMRVERVVDEFDRMTDEQLRDLVRLRTIELLGEENDKAATEEDSQAAVVRATPAQLH